MAVEEHEHIPTDEALEPATLSTIANVLTNSLSPFASWILGKPIYQVDQAKLMGLFGYGGKWEVEEIVSVFGPQDQVQQMVSHILLAINRAPYTTLGRYLVEKELEGAAAARNAVIDHVLTYPHVLESEIRQPIIIIGLPTAGATLLHRLLALDPKARAFKLFELYSALGAKLVPPPSEKMMKSHPNILATKDALNWVEQMFPEFYGKLGRFHRNSAEEIEDDFSIMQHQAFSLDIPTDGTVAEMRNSERYMLQVYIYMKRYLQVLLSEWAPESHIVLKSPQHMTNLQPLLSVFPDARIVIVNRDPVQTIPSYTLYIARLNGMKILPNSINRFDYGSDLLRDTVFGIKAVHLSRGHIVAHRIRPTPNVSLDPGMENHVVKPSQFIDVEWEVLAKDPVACVRGVYAHYGMQVSEAFEGAMRDYLERHPVDADFARDLVGHDEAMEMFGFSEEGIEGAFDEEEEEDGEYDDGEDEEERGRQA
ncbi:hypothetical protein HDU79_005952 [Rhizoclosmatium sp. JEL0117]|nr:hypothetical protein HDU79_005952 [Rhizoclosmatium sp. JEL0117]